MPRSRRARGAAAPRRPRKRACLRPTRAAAPNGRSHRYQFDSDDDAEDDDDFPMTQRDRSRGAPRPAPDGGVRRGGKRRRRYSLLDGARRPTPQTPRPSLPAQAFEEAKAEPPKPAPKPKKAADAAQGPGQTPPAKKKSAWNSADESSEDDFSLDDDSEDEFESAPKPKPAKKAAAKAPPTPKRKSLARRARRPRRRRAPPVAAIRHYPRRRASSARRARSRLAGRVRLLAGAGAARRLIPSRRRAGPSKIAIAQAPKPKKIARASPAVERTGESEDEFAFDDDEPAAPCARAARGGGRAKKAVNYAAVAGSDVGGALRWANSGDESDGFVDSD